MHHLQDRSYSPWRHRYAATLQRDNSVAVIRDVPAEICEDCGGYYLSEPTARRVYADDEETAHRHVEVEIQRYVA